jgi:predicted transcriptional regulator
MSKYTPGPWKIEDDYIEDEKGEIVCHVYLRSEDDMEKEVLTNTANAQLIAAAPELLEAIKEAKETLEAVCEECEDKCRDVEVCGVRDSRKKIEKVIQKTEGDEN